jgi:hypothetical protein
MCGAIPGLRQSALTRARASPSIPRSNRGRCWKTPCSILEPFAGSGSTLIAAEATDRICRAIEIDSLYCDAIIRRWQEMTGGEAILAETGETFATLEGLRLREGEV